MPLTGEVDAVLIELSREGSAETGYNKREKEVEPKHNLGTLFMYNAELGLMNFAGLSGSKMRIGHWYKVKPSLVSSEDKTSGGSVSAVINSDVIKETTPWCETSKTVNETGFRRTYYSGSGMILDVTDEYMLIWHEKLGLISHFSKDLDQKYIHMQVVNFKALSQCESRHCAFHAVAVEPQYETRFRGLQGSSEAIVKAHGTILYAFCKNGDRVVLLDNEKRLLRIGSSVGLEVDEVINVVYYKIQTTRGKVYISGFYFQNGDEEFWDSQMATLQETGIVTEEDLPAKYVNAPKSKSRLSDDQYRQHWKHNFRFWNPDQEDISWIDPVFVIFNHSSYFSKVPPIPIEEPEPVVQQGKSDPVNNDNSKATAQMLEKQITTAEINQKLKESPRQLFQTEFVENTDSKKNSSIEVFPLPSEETTVSTDCSSDEENIPEEKLIPIVQAVTASRMNPTFSSADSSTDVSQLDHALSKPLESIYAPDSIASVIPSNTETPLDDIRAKLTEARAILWRFISTEEKTWRMKKVIQDIKNISRDYANELATIECMNTSYSSNNAAYPPASVPSVTAVDNRPPSLRGPTFHHLH